MSRVLLIGASSIVGHYLIPRLLAAGHEVHGLSRRPRESDHVRWHRSDLDDAAWHQGVSSPEVVFHLAPLWLLPQTLPGLRALSAGRLVAFGSTSVLTKADSPSAAERAVANRLAAAERALAETSDAIAWTLFRPTLIWGGGLDRNISTIAGFIRRFGFFPLAGRAPGLRQPVHADDLAQACLAALDHPESAGQILNLGGGEVLSYRQMVLRIFEVLDRPPRLLSFPPRLLRALVSVARGLGGRADPAMIDRMYKDMVFDLYPARSRIGYAPRPFNPAPEDLGGGT